MADCKEINFGEQQSLTSERVLKSWTPAQQGRRVDEYDLLPHSAVELKNRILVGWEDCYPVSRERRDRLTCQCADCGFFFKEKHLVHGYQCEDCWIEGRGQRDGSSAPVNFSVYVTLEHYWLHRKKVHDDESFDVTGGVLEDVCQRCARDCIELLMNKFRRDV